MSQRTSVHDLESLILSFHSLIAIETVEEDRVEAIVREVAANLRQPLFTWSLTTGFIRHPLGTIDGTTEPLAALQFISGAPEDAIFLFKDLVPHLGAANISRTLRDLAQRLTSTRSAMILTGEPIELARDLDAIALRFRLHLPDEKEMLELVRNVVDALGARRHIEVDLSRDEAKQFVRSLAGLTLSQARRVVAQAIVADNKLSAIDIDRVLRAKGEIIEQSGVLEYFPLEQNTYELGGFERLKGWLDEAKVGFLPEARSLNLRPPKGVLLVGVQGCGKSLAAKFIARRWNMPLLKLDAGRLYDKYVGESEKRFRKAIALAEAMSPVVLWIDEIEKAFAAGGSDAADGGLSTRLFGALLTWLQDKTAGVFVVGAANDLMGVPPELLRKGRFDEIFFVDLPTANERQSIFSIHLQLRNQKVGEFDLATLAEASDGFSGAEIEQAVISALYRSLHAKTPLTTEALRAALKSTVPLSVTRHEDVVRLRREAVGRFTPVA
jgi:ATP-dependent 26S proteasome regulatory subunit